MSVEICSGIDLDPLLQRELSRWNHAQAVVWPDFVLLLQPLRDARLGLWQVQESRLAQAFNSVFAVQTLDVAVLHGSDRLGQDVMLAMCCGQRLQRSMRWSALRCLMIGSMAWMFMKLCQAFEAQDSEYSNRILD